MLATSPAVEEREPSKTSKPYKIKPNERQYQANENQDARITLLDFHEKETKLILREQVDDYIYRNNSNFIRARIKETFFDLRLRLDRD